MEPAKYAIEPSIQFQAWPDISKTDDIKRLFPKSIEEIERFSEMAVREIESSFASIIRVPFYMRDFENTFYAIDKTRALGTTRYHVVFIVSITHTVFAVRQKALECANRIKGAILNYKGHRELYQGCLHAKVNRGESSEKIYAMEEMIREFEREGANLSMPEWEQCRKLKKEIQVLEAMYLNNLEEDESSVWVQKKDLEGVSQKVIDSFEKRGEFCRVPCDTNTYFSVVCFCEVEKTRKLVYLAYHRRAHKKNLPILQSLIEKRRELARLLGYRSYASYDISNQLAKTPENVEAFLDALKEAAKPCAERELKEILDLVPNSSSFINSEKKFTPWNMNYLYSLGKGALCQEDDEVIREYFPFHEALPKLFSYLGTLLNLKISLSYSPVWEGGDIVLEVKDEKGFLLGHILYDLFPRKGKYGHAYCIDAVPPHAIEGQRKPALAVILVNLSAGIGPLLLSIDDISTLLHETGHALHSMLGCSHMPTKSGYRTPTDFIELPPILFENLIYEPAFLKAIGGHYLKGSPLSEKYLGNRKISKNFGKGHVLELQIALSELSLKYFHSEEVLSTGDLRERIYEKAAPYMCIVPNLHFEASFRHLADSLYGSKYYGFLFALAYASEVYEVIKQNPYENWFRFRKIVLEKGGEGNPLDHLKIFLNKIPSIHFFIKEFI